MAIPLTDDHKAAREDETVSIVQIYLCNYVCEIQCMMSNLPVSIVCKAFAAGTGLVLHWTHILETVKQGIRALCVKPVTGCYPRMQYPAWFVHFSMGLWFVCLHLGRFFFVLQLQLMAVALSVVVKPDMLCPARSAHHTPHFPLWHVAEQHAVQADATIC